MTFPLIFPRFMIRTVWAVSGAFLRLRFRFDRCSEQLINDYGEFFDLSLHRKSFEAPG